MKKLPIVAGMVVLLAGCSSSVTQPASPSAPPEPPPSSAAPEPEPEPEPDPVRNPYEAGAERDWAIELDDEPSAVVYDRQAGTAVVAFETSRGTLLEAFSVTNSGRTLPIWDYEVADGGIVGAMDAASGLIYVQVGDGNKSDDLVILNARTGNEELVWSRAHVLDADIPMLVGAYDSGGGIVKLSRESVLAAIVDESGEAIEDERLFMLDRSTDEVEIDTDLVYTYLGSKDGPANLAYPELSVVYGHKCWSVTDGIVCMRLTQDSVVQYDRRGNLVAETDVDEYAAMFLYDVVGLNDDVTSDELAKALAQNVDERGEAAETGEAETREESANAEESAEDAEAAEEGEPHGEAGEGDDATDGSQFPGYRIPAILHDGEWITELPSDATFLPRGAPFAHVEGSLIDVVTGTELVDNPVLVGEGNSANMFFEWDGRALHYLRPLG